MEKRELKAAKAAKVAAKGGEKPVKIMSVALSWLNTGVLTYHKLQRSYIPALDYQVCSNATESNLWK
jgi:hypothetical protein